MRNEGDAVLLSYRYGCESLNKKCLFISIWDYTFAANANQDFSLIAQISPNDEKIINQKVNDINLLLKDLNKDLKIAILAELGLSFTKD